MPALALKAPRAVRAYTPHGGSLLFGHDTLAGRILSRHRAAADAARRPVPVRERLQRRDVPPQDRRAARGLVRVVHNGVSRAEFEPIAPPPDATDLVFLGEMRMLKGIDVLIEAIAQLRKDGRAVTATLVGDGPDRAAFVTQVERLNLSGPIRFMPAMPARQAQPLGRIMVAPSRQESLPYVVLETAAAAMPLITTNVGGIPEIYGPLSDRLVPPGDAAALARAIAGALDDPQANRRRRAPPAASGSPPRFRSRAWSKASSPPIETGVDALHKNGRR